MILWLKISRPGVLCVCVMFEAAKTGHNYWPHLSRGEESEEAGPAPRHHGSVTVCLAIVKGSPGNHV